MSQLPLYLGAFVVVLGVLITAHELGHYLAARWCGVKVLRFSIGFGRPIWRRRLGADRTEWALGFIPLGGYVKMLDEREGRVAEAELGRAFNRQSVGRRSLIVAAGPLANFALAIALYWLLFLTGTNEPLPILGEPPAASAFAEAGVRNGDEVRAVDGEAVASWDELRWQLVRKAVDQPQLVLEVVNEQRETGWRTISTAALQASGWEGDPMQALGVTPYRPPLPARLGKIAPDSPAAGAGLQSGDEIAAFDGQPIALWHDFVGKVRAAAGQTVQLDVVRDGGRFQVTLVPQQVEEGGKVFGRIGAAVAEPSGEQRPLQRHVRYGVVEAAGKAVRETWEKSLFSVRMIGRMLIGEVSWRNLSGPVTIADYAGQSARLGLDYYLRFMALLSISLGVLNLLPVPVLDGGHLLYHIVEVVMRRPLPERIAEAGQRIGLSLLLVMMAFAFFNDISRLVAG